MFRAPTLRNLCAVAVAAVIPSGTVAWIARAHSAPPAAHTAAWRPALVAELVAARIARSGEDEASLRRAMDGFDGVRAIDLVGPGGAVLRRVSSTVGAVASCAVSVTEVPVREGVHAVVSAQVCAPSPMPSGAGANLAGGVAALVFGIAAGLWILRGRSRGVADLVAASERVGRGDLDVRVAADATGETAALAASFNEMVAELALARERVAYLQRIAGWQELARRLAHEIKNPLTPIQLAVQEVARRYEGDDARFRKTLATAKEVVEEEVATLRRLVGAFSEFARLPDVKPAPADLAEFVRDMAASRALLESLDANVKLHFDAGGVPVAVRLDRVMFRRAAENLVRNAAEAIGERGGNVWVRVETRSVEDVAGAEPSAQAWLVVEDDGPGVPEAQRAKIFDPYFTTKATGTGLGLAIVRKIALDHDGDVGLEARPGGGARFVLTLPWRRDGRAARRSFVTFSRAGGGPGADAST